MPRSLIYKKVYLVTITGTTKNLFMPEFADKFMGGMETAFNHKFKQSSMTVEEK